MFAVILLFVWRRSSFACLLRYRSSRCNLNSSGFTNPRNPPRDLLQFPRSHLPAFARVCRAFTPPASTLHYRDLSLKWHFSPMQSVLRTFYDNPNLFMLVKSLNINCYVVRATYLDPDGKWMGTKAGDGILALVDFLRCLKGLRHLSLDRINLVVEYPTVPIFLLKDLEEVMRGLVSLKLRNMRSTFWDRICSHATSLEKVNLVDDEPFFPSFHTQSPLRHIGVYWRTGESKQVGIFVSRFHHHLETLTLTWTRHDNHDANFLLLVDSTYNQLTQLSLAPPDISDLSPVQSLLKSMPSLRYLRWDNYCYPQPRIPLLIPFFSSTINRVDNICWLGSAFMNSVQVASSKHLPELQYDVHNYLVLPQANSSPSRLWEFSGKALLEGVKNYRSPSVCAVPHYVRSLAGGSISITEEPCHVF